MRLTYSLILLMLAGISSSLYADEVSLLSGFYRSQDNSPGLAQKTISLGGRYGLEPNEEKRFWFFDLNVSSTSYSGDAAPDSSTGIEIGAGQQFFFRNFSKATHSFLAWSAGFKSASSADDDSKRESSGIYYRADAGFRFDFSKTFFVDVAARLFDSSLTNTETDKPFAGGAETKTKVTELQMDTFSGADSLKFGVGMVF